MDRIVLNVGGKIFHTTRTTLQHDPNSVLARMFDESSSWRASEKDETGAYFIDRDPKYFRVVLNFLRNPTTPRLVLDNNISVEGVLQEATFFQIQSMIDMIHLLPDISRAEICLHGGPFTRMKLCGLDLSFLSFTETDFQFANITNTNFSHCILSKTDFSDAHGTGAVFDHCNATETQFADADLPNSTFTKAILKRASLPNANFSEADLSGSLVQNSNLVGANFKSANLKLVKFHKSKFKDADFSGANLETCHFSFSDLTGAKNIDWSFHKKMVVKNAILSLAEWEAIPLGEQEKLSLCMAIIN